MERWRNKKNDKLIQALLSLKDKDTARRFLRDLLTEQEIIEFGNRWQAARMLANDISYVAITKETGLSSTTIARIAKWLNRGMNGYRTIINRLSHHHKSNSVGKGLC